MAQDMVSIWFHVLYPFSVMQYLYTAQVHPRVDSQAKQIRVATSYSTPVTVTVFPHQILWYAFHVWILWWQCICCHRRIPKAFSKPEDSISGCICTCSPDSAWSWSSSQVSVQSEREVVPDIYTRMFMRWFWEVHSCPLIELPVILVCRICRCGELYMRKIYTLISVGWLNILDQETWFNIRICASG